MSNLMEERRKYITSLMEERAEKWKTTPLVQTLNQSSLKEREHWLSDLRKEIMFLSVNVATEKARLKEKEDKLWGLIKKKWKLEEEQIQVKVVGKKGKKVFSEEEKELLDFLRKEAKKRESECLKKTKKETQEDGLS